MKDPVLSTVIMTVISIKRMMHMDFKLMNLALWFHRTVDTAVTWLLEEDEIE